MTASEVAILVIGDEILSGDVRETNAHFMARQLFAHGARLRRIEVVPDEVDEIAARVRRLAATHHWLITSGGIGPTHDDRTMEGVAAAFERPLLEHPLLIDMLTRWRGESPSAADRILARLPEGAELIEQEGGFPLLRLQNVFILPGVPRLLEQKFAQVLPHLEGHPVAQRQYRVGTHELAMADQLRLLQAGHPEVAIGSYPEREGQGDWSVRLVLTARDEAALRVACAELAALVPDLREITPT